MSKEFPKTNIDDPIELLKFVAREVIRAEPLRYDQEQWAYFKDSDTGNPRYGAEFPECGTVCCVAGAVVLATKGRPGNNSWYNWEDDAAEILNLPSYDAEKLFSGSAIEIQWEHEGNDDYPPERGSSEYAELGIRHIERFMRNYMGYTGEKL